MPRLKNENLGYYIPSFFEMHVDTNCDDLTINKLPLKDMTVLFHEYIHFLQDFTTYYGLNAIYVYSEYLHSIVNRIYGIETNEFPVPFCISDNTDNVLLNKQILNFTQGDTECSSSYVIDEIEEDVDVLTPNAYLKTIPNVILNINGDSKIFGAIAIMESMAYLMERLCSPSGYMKSPDYPYRSAELVADYYVKDFSKDPLMVLALCDMSLQSSVPGACFVRVMKGIKDGFITFERPEDIYDYFYKQVSVTAYGNESMFLENFKKMLFITQSCIKSYLRDMPVLKGYYDWIDNLVRFAIYLREQDCYFLLKMARHKDLVTNGCWGYVVYKIGSPLMTNNKGDYYKIPYNGSTQDMDVEFFRAIRQIVTLFETGKPDCDMYDWCMKSPNATPNELCSTAPWRKCSEKELCPYSLLWRHWNLSGREPIRK